MLMVTTWSVLQRVLVKQTLKKKTTLIVLLMQATKAAGSSLALAPLTHRLMKASMVVEVVIATPPLREMSETSS